MKKTEYRKKKWEFSKMLAIVTSIFFFGVIAFSLIVWLFQDRIPSEIISTIAVPFSSVTAFYFLKAGYENGKKIDNNNDYYYSENNYDEYM